MTDDEGYEDYEESAIFVGCTCPHSEDEHGWGECGVERCECPGGWEE